MVLQVSWVQLAMKLLSKCQPVHYINSHIPNWFHCEISRVAKKSNIYDSICLCDSQIGMLADSRKIMGLTNNV